MDQGIVALLGVALGFLLPALMSLLRSRTMGKRFATALEEELREAKGFIDQKMSWISRDASGMKDQIDDRLLVDCDSRLLFLGEDETFLVALPFWEQNTRQIVEIISTSDFKRICREVFLIRQYVAKFRDLKLAFKGVVGDPKEMARACYRQLVAIHAELIPDSPLAFVVQGRDPKF